MTQRATNATTPPVVDIVHATSTPPQRDDTTNAMTTWRACTSSKSTPPLDCVEHVNNEYVNVMTTQQQHDHDEDDKP
ncbi:hypothetical protein OG21DRAFT_1490263 [Imleria badia]|nr:hypothetical protein OG21DRAFT_1490263 [Imleria badia]